MNRLILNQGSTFSVGANSANTTIIGTSAGSEVISVGIGAKVVFDPSFNKGGDVIKLAGNAASYTAVRNGSTIVLTDLLGSSITIPVGPVGANIEFADAAPRKLVYDTISRIIKLGSDVIGDAAGVLTAGVGGTQAQFTLTKSVDSVDEDGSVLFTLSTVGVAAGTEYTYTLSGVSAHDVVGGALTGTAKIGADGKAVIQVNLAEDGRTEGTETLSLNVAGVSGAVEINDTSKAPSVLPTYVLKASSPNVEEGGTAVFTLETTDVAPGSQFNYLITGLNSADVVGGQLTGVATIGADGKALIAVNLAADAKTEGAETLRVTAAGVSDETVVNDTSLTPTITEASYALTGSTNVNEGGIATFNLKTTGIAAGSLVGYRIVGTGSAASISQTGTFTVDADGNAVVSVSVANNNTIGDTGLLTVELLNGKSAPVVATVVDTTATTYAADAITAANSASGVLTINVAGTAAQSITLDTDQLTPTNGFVINSPSAAVNVTSSGGADKITLTGNGNNTVNTGNQGDIVLISGSGNNTVVTGAGDDNVTITGTGANRVEVGTGTDKVTGGAGNDTIVMGSGAMDDLDRIDGGDGIDTLVISGDNNEINQTNVKNVENIVLNGTTVTIEDLATLAKLQSIQGSSTTSAVTVNVATGNVVDLTGLALTTLKSITLSGTGTVTLKASAEDLQAVGAILKSGLTAVNLETDVAGYKALSAADTAFNGTKTVVGTAQELIDNQAALAGATLQVRDTVTLGQLASLTDAGIAATKTVSMSVAELLTAAKYPDQKAALTSANTLIHVTGTASVAEATSLISNYGPQIAAYQAAATGNTGISISDTPANVGAAGAAATVGAGTVSAIALTSGSGVSVADAGRIAALTVTGTYSVSDTASAINTAITGPTLPASLAKASSISLTTGNRTATSTAEALELKALGTKLSGGYDFDLSGVTTLSTDDLSAIAGAKSVLLTKASGQFSITEVNTILAQNSAAKVTNISDTALNLSLNASALSAAKSDIYVTSVATVLQANAITSAITALVAAGATVNAGAGRNSYNIEDTKDAVLATSAAAAVKGASAVTATGALSVDEAKSLQALANVTGDALSEANLTYSVSDTAQALATALAATSNSAAVNALARASSVTATTAASVEEAKTLGTAYTATNGLGSAVQVDSYKISDTVSKIFLTATSSTFAADLDDKANDPALKKATQISVTGALTVDQMTALKGLLNNSNVSIFDNKYAIADSASAVASATRSDMVAASGITLKTDAAVADLANLKLLNAALTTAGKPTVSYALTDTIGHITSTDALGSADAAVVAFTKGATAIKVTGDRSSITLNALDDLATKAGTKTYTVEITDTASNIALLSAGVVGNGSVTALIAGDIDVATAKTTMTSLGVSGSAKLSYNLVDSIGALTATADAAYVTKAVNITASGTISAADAAKLVALTGSAGNVTYSVVDSYTNLIAQSSAIADGATNINVTDTSLDVAKYTELLRIAGLSSTVVTTVTAEKLVDTAAKVSLASAAVLTAASDVTLTDNGSLTLSVDQAKGLVTGSNVYKTIDTPTGATVQVKVADTTANLIAAKTASATDTKLAFVLDAGTTGTYKVSAKDVAELSVADATILLSIGQISANFTLKDSAGALKVYGDLSKAQNVTVTGATAIADAAIIYAANSKVSFGAVTGNASTLGANTTVDGVKVYTYANELSKATSVTAGTGTVAQITNVLAAAAGKPVSYSIGNETANANIVDASSTILSGATGIALASLTVTAADAAKLQPYASKLTDTTIYVTSDATSLHANAGAVLAVVRGSGTVAVSGGAAKASEYLTLKADFGAKLASTNVSDTAAAVADFLIAGNTAAGYTLSGSKLVNAAQAKALITASATAGNTLQVEDTAANLLALNNTAQASYKATGTVDLATAKDLITAFTAAKADFAIATTAERFTKAFTFDTVSGGSVDPDSVALAAMADASSLTVDGLAITLGSKNASLIAGSRNTYNTKIVGTVDEINALPAALKDAAGYVLVDSVANITKPTNAALIAGSAGYVVKDSADSLVAASASVLNTTQKALGIEVTGTATVEQITSIMGATDTDAYVVYSLNDTAAHLAPSGVANTYVAGASAVTVDGTADASQGNAIVGANAKAVVNVVDIASALLSASNLNKFASITADADLVAPGIQGVSAANAASLVSGKGANATLTLNIEDTASAVAGALTTTIAAAGSIKIDPTSVASAANAKVLAGLTISNAYTVKDTAANLTNTSIVSSAQLAKAGTVKIDMSNGALAPTVTQLQTLVGVGKLEQGTGANAGKYVASIADTAANVANLATAGLLDGITGTVTVDYTTAIKASEAAQLLQLDTASTNFVITTPSDIKIADSSTNLKAAANAAAVAAAGAITIDDVVSVATLNQVRTAGGTGANEVYTYKLEDSASALFTAGTATVDGATSVRVTGTVSVADMLLLNTRAGFASDSLGTSDTGAASVATSISFAKVSGTIADLSGGTDSNSNGINDAVESKAEVISLNGSATLAQVNNLLADSNFDKVYAIADTAAHLVGAINQEGSLAVLNGASSVGLAANATASAAQATMINYNLANEAKLALFDTAANLNLTANAAAVANAASIKVDAGTGSDAVTAATTAKITYAFDNLADTVRDLTSANLDVIEGKAGDVLDFTGITNWDSGGGTLGTLVVDTNGVLLKGEYSTVRGYWSSVDNTFTASANGTDTQLLIGTDATDGADEIVVILGVTSLTANATAGNDVNYFTFG